MGRLWGFSLGLVAGLDFTLMGMMHEQVDMFFYFDFFFFLPRCALQHFHDTSFLEYSSCGLIAWSS